MATSEEQEFSWSNLSFEDFCKDRIAEELDNYKDSQVAVCDLAFTLTEGENVDGSLFCNTYQSKEFIKHFFEEAGAYVQYEKENFGESRNPFDDAEAFVVCMEINGVEACLAESDYIQEHWNETITLDDDSIAAIKSDLGMAEVEEELDVAENTYVEREQPSTKEVLSAAKAKAEAKNQELKPQVQNQNNEISR